MVGWTIVMIGIMLIGVVVVFTWKQRQAGRIAYWQQQRAVEERKGEAASRLPDSVEQRRKMDHAKASVERIDGELSRLTGSQGAVGHHASVARGSLPRRGTSWGL
jgi:type VI protein secretion system component VasK